MDSVIGFLKSKSSNPYLTVVSGEGTAGICISIPFDAVDFNYRR
jgi:hypothetical protein